MFEGSNSNLRFNFKYEDNNNKESNKYNFNNNNKDFNKYNFNNNKDFNKYNFNNNGNTISDSISATLNKYIIPNNNININNNNIKRENYNKTPLRNLQNSGGSGINSVKNSGIQGNYKEADKLAILNKYKIPGKKNN